MSRFTLAPDGITALILSKVNFSPITYDFSDIVLSPRKCALWGVSDYIMKGKINKISVNLLTDYKIRKS